MSVFVTVGSTSFDELVSAACSKEVLQVLAQNGVHKMVLQVGRGTLFPKLAEEVLLEVEGDDKAGKGLSTTTPPISISWYSYKPSLTADISSASLVLGHGGAGTLLECLSEGTPLVCVPNSVLLHGHQTELAEQMEAEGRIRFCSSTNELVHSVEEHFANKKQLKKGDINEVEEQADMFAAFLEDFMGLR